MSGEPLMCVWQAVYSINGPGNVNYVQPKYLKKVVEKLGHCVQVQYVECEFDEAVCSEKVDFYTFKDYAQNNLRPPGTAFNAFANCVENKCWHMSMASYKSDALNEDDLYKMWTIFNRLCDDCTYPPTMLKEQAVYIFSRIASAIGKPWTGQSCLPDQGFKFQEMIDKLDTLYFSVTSTLKVRQGIENIYTWLVREVMQAGWLQKRTRKESNWTNWQRRWVIMTPGKIEYFENQKQKVKKGEVDINTKSMVDNMSDYKSLFSKMQYRFRLTNAPSFEIEFSADNQAVKESWISLLKSNVNSMKTGITPQMLLLKERSKVHTERNAKDTSEQKLKKAEKLARIASRIYDKNPECDSSEEDELANHPTTLSPEDCENACKIETEKLKKIFYDFDKDGNGYIDRKEFSSFVGKLGTQLEEREIELIFNNTDKDRNDYITFDEFMAYFINCVMESSNDRVSEAKLRAAFLQADRDGSGTINFKEFYEFVSSVRQSLVLEDISTQFQEMMTTDSEDISFGEFKKMFERESSIMERKRSLRNSQNIEHMLREVYEETDVSQLMSYLRKRWKVFTSFKRYGEDDKIVMSGQHGMVNDFVPGSYSLLDLACFNDLPPAIPKRISIPVQWMDSNNQEKSGKVIFHSGFNGEIPIEIATNEYLAYYGCSLADGNQLKVSLLYRHGVQDFTYENNYLKDYVTSQKHLGGAGIEYHQFAHLDCPFEDNSGYFIIGKCEKDLLHLTAFKVPTRHTIYVPGGVIHSNDYLRGTWRTMLSDEAEIKHYHIVKNMEGNGKFVPFTFKFPALLL